MSTVFKAKGLEFDNVVLADDFVSDLLDPRFRREVAQQKRGVVDEFNSIYVGVTRAKRRLRIGNSLKSFLLRSGMLTHVSADVVVSSRSSSSSSEGGGGKRHQCRACSRSIGPRGGAAAAAGTLALEGKMWNLYGADIGNVCSLCMASVAQLQLQ